MKDLAIELNPNYFNAYLNKGLTLKKLEKYDLALETYNKALELKPNDDEAKARMQAILDM